MRKLFLFNLILAVLPAWSQLPEQLVFREKIYDFGEVGEEKGVVDHEFLFTNNSGRQIKILSVDASCGCTTPGWSKDPILPGKTGFVKASFNPRGRPGYFNKTLSVATDLDPNVIILQIKGQVVSGHEGATNEFPIAMGNLHFKNRSFSFGKVFINKEPVQKEFQVKNEGPETIKFANVYNPAYLKVEMPSMLETKEVGTIRITFDGRMKNQYGFASDNIQIITNDPMMEVVSMSVFASLEEYYAPPSGDEILTVPILLIKEQSIDLGRFRATVSIDRAITIKNIGKRQLQIKALQGNCACISASIDSKTIGGGDSTILNISFKPQNRGGTQQKSITVYSNDPRNPVQRINVLAYIED